jgi:hypothetical protein
MGGIVTQARRISLQTVSEYTGVNACAIVYPSLTVMFSSVQS